MRIAAACFFAFALALTFAAPSRAGSQDSLEPRDFKPARIAVVNIYDVFESYEKKKDMENRFVAEADVEKKKLLDQQKEYKKLIEERKNVQEGSERHMELTLKIGEFEYKMKNLEKELFKKFEEKKRLALDEIQKEITAEIKKYAEGLEIDLVLEKQIVAGTGDRTDSIRWPIVHYVKPELEITADIIKRLNAQYGKPAPAPTAPAQAQPKEKTTPPAPAPGEEKK